MKSSAETTAIKTLKPEGITELDTALDRGREPVACFRAALTRGRASRAAKFTASVPVEQLVHERAALIDALLVRAWKIHVQEFRYSLALVAVGGYGRGELHPASDIDVTVLLPQGDLKAWQTSLERFIAFLWDIGLEVGHSVRTIPECVQECRKDVAVATTLMESRLLCGDEELFSSMREAVSPDQLWPAREFFEAKLKEQAIRHRRYHGTAYNLEPNIKSSPGGLRDIQIIGWVANRHFGGDRLEQLVEHGFLTESELEALLEGRAFLWRLRFALHTLTGRREDRLLFDYQIKLAQMLDYQDVSHTLAVEEMMQHYYRTVMELRRLNEMLLQLFQEAILLDSPSEPEVIDEHFQARNGFIEVINDSAFRENPSLLLKLFLVLEQQPDLRGVSARTMRLIVPARNLINDEFRGQPANHRLFREILTAPAGVTQVLRRMNRYGILGRYIPAFGKIVGRMQYDLFHAYTVDAHSLFVVSNLRRFALPSFDHEFPMCSQIMQSLPKPELAYLAGLFHDIAKGRGGDHSELGAADAEAFCLTQGFGRYDARVVAWLVRHHLLLSITAQKKDISDPEVINEFATTVGDQLHLDYLYVLTVADVRATNPKLWNSWKGSLFEELYRQARRALARGLENPIDQEELIAENQAEARRTLATKGYAPAKTNEVWHDFTQEYFLRHSAEEISWQTSWLIENATGIRRMARPLVSLRHQAARGGTAIVVYTPPEQRTLGRVTAALAELGLTILDARIIPCRNGFSIDTYVVLENNGEPIREEHRLREIEATLNRVTTARTATPRVTRKAPRQVRMFATPTDIEFTKDDANDRTVMTLVSSDRPGLLSEVAQVFDACGVEIQTAKITTAGERAEDVFFVTDREKRPLSDTTCQTLQAMLRERLDAREP